MHRHKRVSTLLFGWLLSTLLLLFCGCKTVKPYQRAFLNDEAMQTGTHTIDKFRLKMHSYREGASGGHKGRAGGSCGCN